MNKINFFSTNINKDCAYSLTKLLESGFISAGTQSELFENALKMQCHFANPVTVNSGTSALFLALRALKLDAEDEVIIPAQTFIATGLAVLHNNAKVVFSDIDIRTGNIDVDSIKKKITKKTKCIIPVHWAGYPCDMKEITDIANEYNIDIIEDAAHAMGAIYKNKYVGEISRFTIFSFQAIKHLTTGDGGVVCCKNIDDYELLTNLRWFNIDRKNSKASILGEREYNSNDIGYKLHMNDIAATLGLCNLEILGYILNKHRYIADLYTENLTDIDGIKLMEYSNDRISSYWSFPILVKNRFDFIKKLKSKDIPTSVIHLGIDKNDVFGGKRSDLVNQRYFDENQIHLPINYSMTEEQVYYIIETIKEGW